ncbi:uncharacterized protein EV154DRAFT_561075 [Mucor mucedo]|uniref:uncharacterized protein n=1 Tax=Mucor mucedo TaxID=29922 RepID=UPI00221E6F8B|nr:uncharacterized protein EV154DRAFT_561075 [Mucor mucedo]KAI7893797.1 hypothetical protein EV154DRAFT_561075 [Mucor mucedo]
MRFHLLIAAATVFLSVNAVDFKGNDFKQNVVTCFEDILATSQEFKKFEAAIYSFNASDGYENLHRIEQSAENRLKASITSCCVPEENPVTDQEGTSGVGVVSDYTSNSVLALLIAQSKKDEINKDPSDAAHLHTDLVNLSSQNDALFSCLQRLSPAKTFGEAATLYDTLDDAYVSALKTFSPLHQAYI